MEEQALQTNPEVMDVPADKPMRYHKFFQKSSVIRALCAQKSKTASRFSPTYPRAKMMACENP